MKEENEIEKPNPIQNEKTNNSRNGFYMMILLGVIAMLAWVVLFGLGLLINSKGYRDATVNHFDLANFLMSILTYTPTNIAMLCITAAFSGGCASRLVVAGIEKKQESTEPNPELDKEDSHVYMNENPFSSMLRGLVVYFAFLAGVFVANSDPFTITTPQQYAQSAGVVSFLSFIVGYDPTVFRSLISLAGKMKTK
jgi:hypothetical protein